MISVYHSPEYKRSFIRRQIRPLYETDEEETEEERAEREAYQSADDDFPMIPDDNASRHGPRR